MFYLSTSQGRRCGACRRLPASVYAFVITIEGWNLKWLKKLTWKRLREQNLSISQNVLNNYFQGRPHGLEKYPHISPKSPTIYNHAALVFSNIKSYTFAIFERTGFGKSSVCLETMCSAASLIREEGYTI